MDENQVNIFKILEEFGHLNERCISINSQLEIKESFIHLKMKELEITQKENQIYNKSIGELNQQISLISKKKEKLENEFFELNSILSKE